MPSQTAKRNLWLIRLYFVFYFGGMGSIFPFITLFYVSKGLSGTEIGILNTLVGLGCFIAAPIWGRFSDNARRPRLVLQIALILDCLTLYLVSQQSAFLFLAIFVCLNALAAGGINPQSQVQALIFSEQADTGFGSIRLGGSFGYAVAALVSGWIIQKTSLQSGFILFTGLTLAAAVTLLFIRSEKVEPSGTPTEQTRTKLSSEQVLSTIFKNRELIVFLAVIVVVSIMSNGLSFESVYLQRLGASDAAIGQLSTLAALIEIPMMLLADKIKRIKGSTFSLMAGLFFYILGVLPILIYPSIGSFIITRVVNGLSFSLYTVACTYFITERTPVQQAGTILAFFTVTVVDLIGIVVSPLSGLIFDYAGPYWLYVITLAGYCIAIALVFFLIVRKKTTPLETESLD